MKQWGTTANIPILTSNHKTFTLFVVFSVVFLVVVAVTVGNGVDSFPDDVTLTGVEALIGGDDTLCIQIDVRTGVVQTSDGIVDDTLVFLPNCVVVDAFCVLAGIHVDIRTDDDLVDGVLLFPTVVLVGIKGVLVTFSVRLTLEPTG